MSMTAFAADPGDRKSDTTISVTDLTVGDVVTPYQVIEWKDGECWAFKAPFNTLTADDLKEILGTPAVADDPATTDVDESAAAVPGKITQAMANKIAALATGGTAEAALTGTTWSKANPAPGLYMVVIAAKESGVVYNPAFVGADFDGNNTSNTISITATYSDTAVAKKKTIETLKTVDQNEDSDAIKAAKASMIGDVVSFKITTTIPVFLDSYKNPSFKLTDKVSTGLKLVVDAEHPISVKYGTTTTKNDGTSTGDTNVTITKDSDVQYTAEFAKAYLDAATTPTEVEVTYFAEITNQAQFNVNRDDNTVTVEYSNGPNNEKGVEKDVTNHYTFSIGANIIGKQGKKGYEAVKVGVDKDGNELTELTEVTLDNGGETDKARALQGALFGLYKTEEAAKAEKRPSDADNGLVVNTNYPNGATFTTLEDGIITFTGLDAGTYYLKELDAPNGFIRDTNVHKVVIDATYEEKNITETVNGMEVKYQTSVLKDYTVTIDGHATKYEFDNTGATLVDPVIKDITTDEDRIKNTKGTELPSTGGMGTTVFYVVGSALVIGAAVLLISKRRMAR
jgi:LPXTG-motif cell wall-anchored protein